MIEWILKYVLANMPIERLVAYAINWLISTYLQSGKAAEYYNKSKATLAKVEETIAVARAILDDNKVDEKEVVDAKVKILGIWAEGNDDAALRYKAKLVLNGETNR